ncbi:unnamed protein product [Vitrella brassicaformis CCMP3155]|uniref:Uncharacterized protein n=2 Tax=Vitrella brassicaformis TaxID=1169539 RepID=A0A0G4GZZ6_VITBC|nr:unnamed protein product [Vitrella brassicaformis CCMP3155]|mmetsp:Transcript_51525/g.129436  ORF Transcript_51525/g.129436 Transcript_51525/m.129436 type:complete len:171 (+) Transcript_51525:98-610(+)|eukprot:CEM36864.1 unnamed protein product [Vitrella brassicaformis CCMP3155]
MAERQSGTYGQASSTAGGAVLRAGGAANGPNRSQLEQQLLSAIESQKLTGVVTIDMQGLSEEELQLATRIMRKDGWTETKQVLCLSRHLGGRTLPITLTADDIKTYQSRVEDEWPRSMAQTALVGFPVERLDKQAQRYEVLGTVCTVLRGSDTDPHDPPIRAHPPHPSAG